MGPEISGALQLQYLSDGSGITTGIQIQMPTEEWLLFKEKYKELDVEGGDESVTIPQWQMDFGRHERGRVNDGAADISDWEITRKELGL